MGIWPLSDAAMNEKMALALQFEVGTTPIDDCSDSKDQNPRPHYNRPKDARAIA